MHPRPPGFSLVELLVVVAIMGLMAGTIAMSLRGLRSPALASAANEVASGLKLARQQAISTRKKSVVLFPIATNALLTNNAFRCYAIFEEVSPGDVSSDGTVTNEAASSQAKLVPRTDWRVLPEGVVFCNLITSDYRTINDEPFGDGFQLGVPTARTTRLPGTSVGSRWRYFTSFTNNAQVVRPDGSSNQLTGVPFIGFFPSGRAYYANPGQNANAAAIRLIPGVVQNNALVSVTDINNFYYVEADPVAGRIRVRAADSYR